MTQLQVTVLVDSEADHKLRAHVTPPIGGGVSVPVQVYRRGKIPTILVDVQGTHLVRRVGRKHGRTARYVVTVDTRRHG